MRLPVCAVAVVVLIAAATSPSFGQPDEPPDYCDDEYECVYQSTTTNNITFTFDLRPLCATGSAYSVNDSGGHTYNFNICGYAAFECEPTWSSVYRTGVAVQFWGSPPPCNHSAPQCTDYYGQPVCCTSDCEVLGVGPPVFQLKQPNNPQTGGILVTHRGAPPAYVQPLPSRASVINIAYFSVVGGWCRARRCLSRTATSRQGAFHAKWPHWFFHSDFVPVNLRCVCGAITNLAFLAVSCLASYACSGGICCLHGRSVACAEDLHRQTGCLGRGGRCLCRCRRSEDDPFFCPWDPKTQSQRSRTITYDFTCDLTMPAGART